MTRAPTASQLKKACEIARETETRITLPDGTVIEPVNLIDIEPIETPNDEDRSAEVLNLAEKIRRASKD